MKNLLFDIDDMVVYKGVKLELSVSNIYNYIKNEVDIIEYLESEILPIRRNILLDKLLMN
jgi:ACT domain-containing protein